MEFELLKAKLAEDKPKLPWREYLESEEFKVKHQAVLDRFEELKESAAEHPLIRSRETIDGSAIDGFHVLTSDELAAIKAIHPDWYDAGSLEDGAKPCIAVTVGHGVGVLEAYTELTFVTFDLGKPDVGSCDPYDSFYEWVGHPNGIGYVVDAPYAGNATGNVHPDEQLKHIEAALALVACTPLVVWPH